MQIRYLAILTTLCLICAGCEGPVGPQGPQGPAGESVVGPEGPPGEDAIPTILVFHFAKEDLSASGESVWKNLNVPEITREVVDSGAVVAHYSQSSGEHWNTLPHTQIFFDGSSRVFSYSYGTGYFSYEQTETGREAEPIPVWVKVLIFEPQ